MPSYGGAHGPDGTKKTGDQGQGARDKDGGATGGGKSVGGDRPGFGGGSGGARSGLTSQQQKTISAAYADPSRQFDIPSNERAWRSADADSREGGFWNSALEALTGIRELSPYDDPDYTPGQTSANYGLNSGNLVGSLAGMASGIPGLGMIGGWLGQRLGAPEIGFGPNVLSRDPTIGPSMADIRAATEASNAAHGYAPSAPGGGVAPNMAGGNPNRNGGISPTQVARTGPMSPRSTGMAPSAPTAPGAAGMPDFGMGLMSQGSNYLSVPGGQPYGVMTPSFNWSGPMSPLGLRHNGRIA